MRKRKISSVGLAAILSVTLISGGIYAWFISQDAAAQVVVTTPDPNGSTDSVAIDPLVPQNPDKIVPDTPVTLVPEDQGKTTPEISNPTTQPVVVELNLSSDSLLGMLVDGFNPATNAGEDWLPAYETVYTENDVEIATNIVKRYTFSQERLKEVVKLSLDTSVNTAWVQSTTNPDFYYTVIESGAKVSLDTLTLTVLGELGGMKKDANGDKSPSRQFEQKSEFRALITISSMVSQEGAIESQFGTDVLQALKDKGFNILK